MDTVYHPFNHNAAKSDELTSLAVHGRPVATESAYNYIPGKYNFSHFIPSSTSTN
jgi:hypothetical protein